MQGDPLVLVLNGKLLEESLHKARMTTDEVLMAVREHGVQTIEDADLVVLEVDGNISVLSSDFAKKSIQRRKKPQLTHNP